MDNSTRFKLAHKNTEEVKNLYPEINYMAQFGLELKALYQQKNMITELKGSEKQVKWAEDIREAIITTMTNEDRFNEVFFKNANFTKVQLDSALANIKKIEDAKVFIDIRHSNIYELVSNYMELDEYFIIDSIKSLMENEKVMKRIKKIDTLDGEKKENYIATTKALISNIIHCYHTRTINQIFRVLMGE